IKIFDLIYHQPYSCLRIKSFPVGSFLRKSRISVADSQDPASQRDLISLKILGITASIIIFMMIIDTLHHKTGISPVYKGFASQLRGPADIFDLIYYQRVLFAGHISGKPQFSDIVKDSRQGQLIALILWQAHDLA